MMHVQSIQRILRFYLLRHKINVIFIKSRMTELKDYRKFYMRRRINS